MIFLISFIIYQVLNMASHGSNNSKPVSNSVRNLDAKYVEIFKIENKTEVIIEIHFVSKYEIMLSLLCNISL